MFKSYALGLGLATAFSTAQAGNVTSLTIEDVSGDGISGARRYYFPIDDSKLNAAGTCYDGASCFTSDVGPIDTSMANGTGSFSNGFVLGGGVRAVH